MLQNTVANKRSYALKSYADYKAQILENQLSGLLLKIEGNEVWVKLIGTLMLIMRQYMVLPLN
jgi:UDP-N-acetylmuramoyl-L-alanyl-D-glutamate--2,6-diaminopimelate ligase